MYVGTWIEVIYQSLQFIKEGWLLDSLLSLSQSHNAILPTK